MTGKKGFRKRRFHIDPDPKVAQQKKERTTDGVRKKNISSTLRGHRGNGVQAKVVHCSEITVDTVQ